MRSHLATRQLPRPFRRCMTSSAGATCLFAHGSRDPAHACACHAFTLLSFLSFPFCAKEALVLTVTEQNGREESGACSATPYGTRLSCSLFLKENSRYYIDKSHRLYCPEETSRRKGSRIFDFLLCKTCVCLSSDKLHHSWISEGYRR